MQLMPKRVKYRKEQRGRMKGKAMRGNRVSFGEFGLMSLESGWVAAREIEAGRVAAAHFLGKEGRLYTRIFPHKPISKRPPETRMGKGKGEPEFYAAVVKPGTLLYEISGVSEELARETMNRIAHKMSVRCKLVQRRHGL